MKEYKIINALLKGTGFSVRPSFFEGETEIQLNRKFFLSVSNHWTKTWTTLSTEDIVEKIKNENLVLARLGY